MGAAPIVSGVLGGVQLVSGLAGASAERKRAEANDKAQQARLDAEYDSIQAQKQAAWEQGVLSRMEQDQQKLFAQYQSSLAGMQRDATYANSLMQMDAQQRMEAIQAQQAQTGAQAGLLSEYIQATQAQLQSNDQLYNQLGQTEQMKQQAAGEQAGAEMQYLQSEAQRADEQRALSTQLGQGQAQVNEQLETGSLRRATMQSMLAASGALDSESTRAMLNRDVLDDVNSATDKMLEMYGMSGEAALRAVNEGKLSELTRDLNINMASAKERQALEAALMASLKAKAFEENLASNIGLAQMGTTNELTNIDQTVAQNQAGRATARNQLDMSYALDQSTQRMNDVTTQQGLLLQSGATASNQAAQQAALAAQQNSLVFVPSAKPSMVGTLLGGLANTASGVYGAMNQQQLMNRQYNDQSGLLSSLRNYRDNYSVPEQTYSGNISNQGFLSTPFNSNANNAGFGWTQDVNSNYKLGGGF